MPDDLDPIPSEPEARPEDEGRTTPETAQESPEDTALVVAPPQPAVPAPPPAPPAAPPKPDDDEDDGEEGMLRMSFLDHLEELRMRLVRALMGIGISFALCLFFANEVWKAVVRPATDALKALGYAEELVAISPTEMFSIIWIKVPLLTSLFVAAPWVIYQVWAFIAPGLYKRERRYATPFILSCAGLFILGGCFAYFVAFRFGLIFLLGIGKGIYVRPTISVSEYFDLFVNVILGVSLVFELPVLIVFLTLLRVASPRFLLAHSRYAILIIVVLAAIITPTPDVANLAIFAAPMVLLYFAGVFASYLLVLGREGKRFPWGWVLSIVALFLIIFSLSLILAVTKYGYSIVRGWPFLVR